MYNRTKQIIETYFIDRLSLHKTARDIYVDNNLFEIAKFRNEVNLKHNTLLENDKYIYELAYLYAENNTFSPIEDYLNKCRYRLSTDIQRLKRKSVTYRF